MMLGARTVIYVVAAVALVAGIMAYGLWGEQHDHEEEGLLEGDVVMVAAVGSVLAVVAVVSFVYLMKGPSEEK